MNNEFGTGVAITLTPVAGGRLEVYLDGEALFDRRKAGHYPSHDDVTQLVMSIKEKTGLD